MDAETSYDPFSDHDPATAFEFTGRWQEFAPIAFTNLLLTIVTLGIYRFWAKARERRYLWSRSRFIDDRLEWAGTGREMFFGFLVVMAVLIPIVLIFQFVIQAMILRGQAGLAFSLGGALYLGIFYLLGLAVFRALRYRLSRTYWHGIRGGSDDGGWRYGLSALWKPIVGFLSLGLLAPWSMVSLWNERWSAMSFGPHRFASDANVKGLLGRWLLIYLTPFIMILLMIPVGMAGIGGMSGQPSAGMVLMAMLSALIFYAAFLLVSLSYYAAYYRQVVGATSLGGVKFIFTARTKDWLMLIVGHVGLVIVTLGIGLLFIGYRNWSFAIHHLEATGEVDLTEFTQTTVRPAGDAEGLASAFDIGAI